MKKVLVVLLAVVLVVAFASTAYAAVPMPMYTYISDADADLDIISGTAYCDVEMVSSGTSSRVSAYLQRYSGGSWSTVKHWSRNYADGDFYWSASYSVSSGYNYRLKAYCYAYYGNNTESAAVYAYDYY